MRTVTLSGLPGTHGRSLDAVLFSRSETAARLLKYHRAISASGPLGAINIWRDDEGQFCCERYYFMRTQASAAFPSLDEVEPWLRANLPLIGKEAA